MTFEYKLAMRRNRTLPAFREQLPEPAGRPPRVARLIALAHKLEGMVRSGVVKDRGELARRARVSLARIHQIMILGQLAPDIQEYVLFLSSEHAGLITEPELREIARQLCWDRQRDAFRELLSRRT